MLGDVIRRVHQHVYLVRLELCEMGLESGYHFLAQTLVAHVHIVATKAGLLLIEYLDGCVLGGNVLEVQRRKKHLLGDRLSDIFVVRMLQPLPR
jgi:hypothetical protein